MGSSSSSSSSRHNQYTNASLPARHSLRRIAVHQLGLDRLHQQHKHHQQW
jgi:hypothetical protein